MISNRKAFIVGLKSYKLSNNEKPELAFLCMILPVANSTLFVKLNTTISGISNLEKTFINFCKTFKIVE